jgi:hypothetical protein
VLGAWRWVRQRWVEWVPSWLELPVLTCLPAVTAVPVPEPGRCSLTLAAFLIMPVPACCIPVYSVEFCGGSPFWSLYLMPMPLVLPACLQKAGCHHAGNMPASLLPSPAHVFFPACSAFYLLEVIVECSSVGSLPLYLLGYLLWCEPSSPLPVPFTTCLPACCPPALPCLWYPSACTPLPAGGWWECSACHTYYVWVKPVKDIWILCWRNTGQVEYFCACYSLGILCKPNAGADLVGWRWWVLVGGTPAAYTLLPSACLFLHMPLFSCLLPSVG